MTLFNTLQYFSQKEADDEVLAKTGSNSVVKVYSFLREYVNVSSPMDL